MKRTTHMNTINTINAMNCATITPMSSPENADMTIAQLCQIKVKRAHRKQYPPPCISSYMDEVCVGSIEEIGRSEDDKLDETKMDNDNSEKAQKRIAASRKAHAAREAKKPCKNFKKWWRNDEVCLFYKAMMACGINFSLIEAYMGYTRTQKQLKLRYTTECKQRPHLIEQVIQFRGSIDDADFTRIMDSISHNINE